MNIFGPATVSAKTFAAAIPASSPVLRERKADAYYNLALAYGVDPAFALGWGLAEHGLATDSKAVVIRYGIKNWGDCRTRRKPTLGGKKIGTDRGDFWAYDSWYASLDDALYRITDPAYDYQKAKVRTVEQMAPIAAPRGDHDNDPKRWADNVIAHMRRAQAMEKGGSVGLTIIKKLTPHNTSGPRGHKARAVVWHVAEGSEAGVTSWFHSPQSQASTHYLVCKDGRIIQYVDEAVTPWANGVVNKPRMANPVVADIVNSKINPNRLTISIETEGFTGEFRAADSPLGRSLAQLTREIMQRHGIPIDDNHILGHNELDSVNRPNCPGNLDWDGLLAAVKGSAVTPQPPQPQPMPAGYMEPGQPDTYTWQDAAGVIVYRKVRYYQPKDDKYYEAEWSAEQGETPFEEVR